MSAKNGVIPSMENVQEAFEAIDKLLTLHGGRGNDFLVRVYLSLRCTVLGEETTSDRDFDEGEFETTRRVSAPQVARRPAIVCNVCYTLIPRPSFAEVSGGQWVDECGRRIDYCTPHSH